MSEVMKQSRHQPQALNRLGLSLCLAICFGGLSQACGVNDRQYIENPNWSSDNLPNYYCYDHGDTFYSSNSYEDLEADDAISQCQGVCDSLRPSRDCQGVVVSLASGDPSPGTAGNSWLCDYYTGTLPSVARTDYSCDIYATSVAGYYRETINSCFAASTSDASTYCKSLYPALPGPATAYTLTATSFPGDIASSTEVATVTVTTVVSTWVDDYVTGTRTSLVTQPTTTVTVEVSAVVVSTVVVSQVFKVSTLTTTSAPTVTTTKTVCKALRHLQARTTGSAPPSCLTNNGLPTPSSVISSGCSCLFDVTSTAVEPTTLVGATMTTATVTITLTSTASSTSVDITTSEVTVDTVDESIISTQTVISTSTKLSTSYVTRFNLKTSFSYVTKATTAKTKTVTQQVVKTAIPTFALYVQPAPTGATTPKKYRLYSRMLPGGASNNDPESRVFQYQRKADGGVNADYPGVNATIIDGQLYVISGSKNEPKLYGVSMKIEKGVNAGRIVIGQQVTDTLATSLKGCAVNPSTKVLTCNTADGKVAGWQELAWPGKQNLGTLTLALIPAGGGSQYKPVMQLVAGAKGSVQIGC